MKSIKDLTKQEAIDLVKFVYPDEDFMHFSNDQEFHIVTMTDGNGGQQRGAVYFYYPQALLWLYQNGFDITECLKQANKSDITENKYNNLVSRIYQLGKMDISLEQLKQRILNLYNTAYDQV